MPAMTVERRKFTQAEVMQMSATGILREGEHVELIDGDLIMTSPQGPEHADIVSALAAMLYRTFGAHAGCTVRVNSPLDVGDPITLPEPDLAVVRGGVSGLRSRHPRGDETVLVIEVSRTSHRIDHEKIERYARAGVPVYWIVDVPARVVEWYVMPMREEGRYETQSKSYAADTLQLPGLDPDWCIGDLFSVR